MLSNFEDGVRQVASNTDTGQHMLTTPSGMAFPKLLSALHNGLFTINTQPTVIVCWQSMRHQPTSLSRTNPMAVSIGTSRNQVSFSMERDNSDQGAESSRR